MDVQIFSTLKQMEMKDWIRAARLYAKLTQERLAECMGLTKGNISAWENGRHEASHEQLIKLASITGFPEPLPGLDFPLSHSPARWPFRVISQEKIESLDKNSLEKLEAIMLLGAAQLGIDIKKEG